MYCLYTLCPKVPSPYRPNARTNKSDGKNSTLFGKMYSENVSNLAWSIIEMMNLGHLTSHLWTLKRSAMDILRRTIFCKSKSIVGGRQFWTRRNLFLDTSFVTQELWCRHQCRPSGVLGSQVTQTPAPTNNACKCIQMDCGMTHFVAKYSGPSAKSAVPRIFIPQNSSGASCRADVLKTYHLRELIK